MRPSGIITLMTDFGSVDTFTGEVKGVILTINRNAKIIDITHNIEPFNILEASIKLSSYWRYFPDGTVHMVIVDPGVGSKRRPLVVETKNHYFVGPDNGVFTTVIDSNSTIYEITEYVRGSTFHGRDLFAPVSARLSTGEMPDAMARKIEDPVLIDIPSPEWSNNTISGKIILIDRFGNCITNIKESNITGKRVRIFVKDIETYYCTHYEDGIGKGLSCLINSSGYLEIFKYTSSASTEYNLNIHDPVRIELH